MKKHLYILLMFVSVWAQAAETIKIKAADGVEVTLDLYIAYPDTVPMIVLFHQAGWSRGEYLEIAPKLNQMGFNCMAVDQRSGGRVNNVDNQTTRSARNLMKETKYVDALPDMRAAILHAKEFFAKKDLIILGSSYSSALVLKLAGDMPDVVDGVLAFSPGEYFKSMGKPKDYITTSAMNIQCPSFITSARGEKSSWWSIYETIPTDSKKHYLPTTSGNHGARALWSKFPDHKGYWAAVSDFLSRFL